MIINVEIRADNNEDMPQKLDVALFKLSRHINEITRLEVDEQMEFDNVVISRSE